MEPLTRTCRLAGFASVRIAAEDVAARRRAPGPECGPTLPPSLLRQADEQTVACVAAVLHAIHGHHLAPDGPGPFRDWGIVAAPRFIGRDLLARDIPAFRDEGPWGVSPHVIPHRSLHSPSGAVSVALGIRGPNFGAGGGPCHEAEGLLAALSLLWDGGLPGVWLLSSRIDPLTDAGPATGTIPPGTFAEATAVALMPGAGVALHPGRWETFSLRALLAEAALSHITAA